MARAVARSHVFTEGDYHNLPDRRCTGAPDWIVDPMKKTAIVYHLADPDLGVDTYTFQDKIKAGIYDDLWIDLKELGV